MEGWKRRGRTLISCGLLSQRYYLFTIFSEKLLQTSWLWPDNPLGAKSPLNGRLTMSMTFLIKTTCQYIPLQPLAERGLHHGRWQQKEQCGSVLYSKQGHMLIPTPWSGCHTRTKVNPGNCPFEVNVHTWMKKDISVSYFPRSGPHVQNS